MGIGGGIMSKFYDYIKSKEKEIGKDFFCNTEIGKTEQKRRGIKVFNCK